jgi:hypothetical protein
MKNREGGHSFFFGSSWSSICRLLVFSEVGKFSPGEVTRPTLRSFCRPAALSGRMKPQLDFGENLFSGNSLNFSGTVLSKSHFRFFHPHLFN